MISIPRVTEKRDERKPGMFPYISETDISIIWIRQNRTI
jgi:hypothetical protein